MSLYRRIKDLREDADKTQTDVASYLGTTAQYYGKYEKGERELPFSRAVALAEYYHVSLDYLAERINDRKMPIGVPINEDERQILEKYRQLTERNKGKAELFIDQLSRMQKAE